jgi:hypothetical protein
MFRHQNSIFVSVLFVLTGACSLSIMTLNIKGINMTVSIKNTQHNNIAIMLSVLMLNVIMLSVVAPFLEYKRS